VLVRIDAKGTILGANVSQSSGASSLDDAALAGILAVRVVDAPPKGTGDTSLSVPIAFRLD
jgi:TonB family protein